MATMYAPGARRSAAPRYSPRAALTSEALYDDQVTKDLLDAMLSAVQPAGVGQSQAGVNLGEALGSGTSIADFNLNGGGEGLGDSGGTAPTGGTAGLGTVGDIGQAFSALGVIGQDPSMAQLGQVMGQVATIGTAAGQAAQGNLGQAAMTVAPMGLSALGVPGGLASIGMTAANPALGPVDTQAAIVNAALSALAPPVAAVTSLAQMMGLVPSTKGMLTPVENINVNAMVAEQEAMQAMMEDAAAIAQGFDSAVTDSTVGITGAEAASADNGGFGGIGIGDSSSAAAAAAAVGADGTDGGAGGSGVGGGTAGATGADGTDGGAGGAGTAAAGDAPGDSAGGGGGGGGGACFLTTAVVEHMGHQDDGEVLSTLRRFRDSYMRKNAEKVKDVAWYYEHAPRIVAALSRSPNVDKLYRNMYDNYIYPSYEAIKANNMELAYELYKAGVVFAQEASGVKTADRVIPSTST